MTAPTAPRQALELLEALRDRAESAAAARLEQMHGHLSTNHRASGYDGTAAQIHAQYAHALAPIVEALRAQAEAEAEEHKRLSYALEHDRAHVAKGVHSLQRVLEGYSWLTEGRGPYAHDDDRWRDEFGNALREIGEALEPLRRIGRDRADCPTLWADIQAARNPRAQAEAAGLREALAWYADPLNWERGLGREGPQGSPAMDDEGQRARAALAQAGGESQ